MICGGTFEKLLERTKEEDVIELVIVDLANPRLELASTMQTIQSRIPTPRVIAFGPHVHVELLKQAKVLGCEVYTRGQFDQAYRELLSAAS